MAEDWSDSENRIIVEDYFSMLILERQGIAFNKTEHRNRILSTLNNRGKGAVEYKHQNISAVLAEMGIPFIDGYKPAYNFQKSSLIAIVDQYLRKHPKFEDFFRNFSEEVPEFDADVEFSSWLVNAPELKDLKEKRIILTRRPYKINYLQKEQDNRTLGLKGEALVFDYEKELLRSLGKESLADKVEWVSKDHGDGLGYDILSKNLNGTDKYLEVKTTKLNKESPFFFSANEYHFSKEKGKNFFLYRVFDFRKTPKLFTLNGCFDDYCRIEPTQFIGRF